MTICSPINFIDNYFFGGGFSYGDDVEQFFDAFERLGLIYVSRNKNTIIIRNNVFSQNIGTFGGAITINSPNWLQGVNLPLVFINDNTFTQNMAYFSGNAVYIRSTMNQSEAGTKQCGGVFLQNNTFTKNTGLKLHNGGAVSALCSYINDQKYDDYSGNSGQIFSNINSQPSSITLISDRSVI